MDAQDYIKESDNLVSLHDQIHDCDSILSQMETLLSGFQVCDPLAIYIYIYSLLSMGSFLRIMTFCIFSERNLFTFSYQSVVSL